MPESILIATLAGAAGGIATGAAIGITGAALATFALINAGIAAATSTLAYLLRDKPSEQKSNIKQTIRAAVTPVRYVLGRCRLSGVLAYINTRRDNDRILDMALLLSEGRCGEIERIWVNGTEVTFVRTLMEAGKYIEYKGGRARRVVNEHIVNGTYTRIGRTKPAPEVQRASERIDARAEFNLTRMLDINEDFGRGGISKIQLFETGVVRTVGLSYNKDAYTNLVFRDSSGTILTVENVTNAMAVAANNLEVIAFFEQIVDGETGTVDIEMVEGQDFTDKFTLYLYNNPANIATNGKSLRDVQPQEWTDEHQLRGVTWCHIELIQPDYKGDIDKRFWSNIPEIQVLMQGKWITWPNQPIAKWTDNAAAIRYWYMITRLGTAIRNISNESVVRAFNKCEENVDTVLSPDYAHFANSHKRYTIDGLISSGDDVETILFEMDQAWQGNVIYRDGMYYFEVGEEPTEFVAIDRDTIIDSVQIQPAPALQDRINSAGIVLSQGGPISDWTEFHLPTIDDEDAIKRDGQKRHHALGTRQFISDPISAGRIMAIALKRARGTMRLTYRFMPFTKFELGKYYLLNDIVFGLVDFKVRCEAIVLNVDWSITVTFSEYIDKTYADTLILPPLVPRNIRLPIRGRADVELPFNITLFARYEVTETGAILWWIEVSWDKSLHLMEIEIDGPDGWHDTFETLNDNLSILVPVVGIYILTFVNVSNLGRRSDDVVRTIDVGFEIAPLAPINLDAQYAHNTVTVTWENNPNSTPATSYALRYRIENESIWTTINNLTSAYFSIAQFHANTVYEIQVKAINSYGESEWTDIFRTNLTSPIAENAPHTPDAPYLNNAEETVLFLGTKRADTGSIPTQYRWRYGTPTEINNGTERTIVSKLSIVVIRNLLANTQYQISVRAENSNGVSAYTEFVTVRTAIPNRIPSRPTRPLFVTAGKTSLTLTTRLPLSGGRANLFRWRYSKNAIIKDGDPTVTSTSLRVTIPNLDAGTTYYVEVRAENDSGNSEYSYWDVDEPNRDPSFTTAALNEPAPGPVRNLREHSDSHDFIIAVWDAPNTGGIVNEYEVQQRKDGETIWNEVGLDLFDELANGRSIIELTADTTYNVRVRAVGPGGDGSWTTVNMDTDPEPVSAAPNKPENFRVGAQGTTWVQLNWDVPATGVAPNFYIIEYKLSSETNWGDTTRHRTRLFFIRNLVESAAYDFRVRAVVGDIAGQTALLKLSEWVTIESHDLSNLLPGKPATPVLVSRTTTSLTVRTAAGSGSPPTSYRFQLRTAADVITSYDSNSSQITITGLTPNTAYSVRAFAINSAGESPSSDYFITGTLAEPAVAPGPVRNLRLDTRTAFQISVRWDTPNTGGPANDYDVQYRKSGATSWTTESHDGTHTINTITNLSASTSYEIEVRANGHGGNSSWTRITLSTIAAPVNAPGPPQNVHTQSIGTNEITVDWSPPIAGGTVTGYDVWYTSAIGTPSWLAVTRSGTTTQQRITGLTANHPYHFAVRATGPGGESEFIGVSGRTNAAIATLNAPTNVSGTRRATGSVFLVTVTWDAPSSGATPDGYDVHFMRAGLWYIVPGSPTNASARSIQFLITSVQSIRVRSRRGTLRSAWVTRSWS